MTAAPTDQAGQVTVTVPTGSTVQAAAPVAAPTAPPKFADKYDNPEQLEQGVREIRKQLGLADIDGKIYGDGGLYADVTAAERGYRDMSTMLRGRGQGDPSTSPPETPAQAPEHGAEPGVEPGAEPGKNLTIEGTEAVTVESVLAKAQLTPESVAQQWQAEGQLTEAQYTALTGIGYPRAIVDSYVKATEAQAQLRTQNVQHNIARAVELAGGEGQLDTVFAWASTNLPKDRVADMQGRLDRGMVDSVMTEMMASHQQAVGAGGTQPLATATGAPPVSGGGFGPGQSAEYFAALRKAVAGDQAAIARVNATSQTAISNFA